jgi:hypothetical protein
MNLREVLSACERARAAYVMDSDAARTAMERLGQTWVGQYRVGSVQAALTMREGAGFLSISGTRFSDGQVEDLLEDLEVEGKDVGGGAKVASGPFEGCLDCGGGCLSNCPPPRPCGWRGTHSGDGGRITARYSVRLPALQVFTCSRVPKRETPRIGRRMGGRIRCRWCTRGIYSSATPSWMIGALVSLLGITYGSTPDNYR